jgi:hypothetical protein
MPLTDLEIRRAKPAEKTYTKADGNGLSLQIEPNGSKDGDSVTASKVKLKCFL